MLSRVCTGRKADPQHANPMLDDEAILAEYCTLAEFTFGLPRYHVIFTSHRIILKEKQRFFGLLGKDAEEFVCYRCAHHHHRPSSRIKQTATIHPTITPSRMHRMQRSCGCEHGQACLQLDTPYCSMRSCPWAPSIFLAAHCGPEGSCCGYFMHVSSLVGWHHFLQCRDGAFPRGGGLEHRRLQVRSFSRGTKQLADNH